VPALRAIRYVNNQLKEPPVMDLAIAGGTVMGANSFNNSLLDIITERLRSGWRSFTRSVRHQ